MSKNNPIDLKKPVDYSSLEGRNVLITGGASGFGKAFVELFSKSGANVVIADISEKPGQELEKILTNNGGK
jgi:NAD(P)-dependent dehydrogenase (short-subunit alcohol dehydrogenase family)